MLSDDETVYANAVSNLLAKQFGTDAFVDAIEDCMTVNEVDINAAATSTINKWIGKYQYVLQHNIHKFTQ